MTNKIKWILFIFFAIIISFIIGLAYEIHFKDVINEYHQKQIERNLENNFNTHWPYFDDLVSFSNQIKKLEYLEFRKNDGIFFRLKDSLLVDSLFDGSNSIQIGDNYLFSIDSLSFSDSNSVWIRSNGEKRIYSENWMIYYEGKISDPMLAQLLSYNNTTITQLSQLKDKLRKINCDAFSKADSLISFRYRGHWGEGFDYIVPLKNSRLSDNWIKLDDNYYWEHYRNGLFCGMTDWGYFRKLRQPLQ